MRAILASLLLLAMLSGCTRTVLVNVPPHLELNRYETIGVIEFTSSSDHLISAQATRRFQEQIHAAQPGTRLIELGNPQAVAAAVGAQQFDAAAFKRIGERYGVDAVFLGDLNFSQPQSDIKVTDLRQLKGEVRTEVRGDISSRLVETRSGASVWSDSAWATRQVGRMSVSDHGVRANVHSSSPHEEMLAPLIHHLTQDFRPTTARQRAN